MVLKADATRFIPGRLAGNISLDLGHNGKPGDRWHVALILEKEKGGPALGYCSLSGAQVDGLIKWLCETRHIVDSVAVARSDEPSPPT